MAKIITRDPRLMREVLPVIDVTTGRSVSTKKMPAGSVAASKPPRGRTGEAASEAGISATLRREQPCRADIEHDRHQQVDQHRGDGRTYGPCRRWAHGKAQDVDRERPSERVDDPDE